MMLKKRLMTPGPTHVGEAARLVAASAHAHHRSAAFADDFVAALEGLAWLFDTDDVVVVTGSGTAGMEAAMRSTIGPAHRVAVITGGKFAERWRDIARLITPNVEVFELAWGEGADPDAWSAWLDERDPFDAFVAVASETSTGILHPVRALSARFAAHSPDGVVLIDGITAVGAAELSMRRDGFDVLVSGSQKAFGLPPGAAFVGMSARAWQRADEVNAPSYYFDLRRERAQLGGGKSAFTPNVPVILGLREVLDSWRAAGRDALFAHAELLRDAAIAGAEAAGLSLFGSGDRSPALTSVEVADAESIRARLRTHYGVSIAGGQNELKGRILRVGHIGPIDAFDMSSTWSAIACALVDAGHDCVPGEVAAATVSAVCERLRTRPSHLFRA